MPQTGDHMEDGAPKEKARVEVMCGRGCTQTYKGGSSRRV